MQGSRPDTDTIDINSRINIDLTDNQSLSLGAQYYKDEQDTNYGPDYGKIIFMEERLTHILGKGFRNI